MSEAVWPCYVPASQAVAAVANSVSFQGVDVHR